MSLSGVYANVIEGNVGVSAVNVNTDKVTSLQGRWPACHVKVNVDITLR